MARTNIKHYVNCKNSPLDDQETGEYSGTTSTSTSSSNSTQLSSASAALNTTSNSIIAPLPLPEEVDGFKKPFSPAISRPDVKIASPRPNIKTEENVEHNPDVFFPISMPIVYGGIDIPGIPSKLSNQFPHNVSFVQVSWKDAKFW